MRRRPSRLVTSIATSVLVMTAGCASPALRVAADRPVSSIELRTLLQLYSDCWLPTASTLLDWANAEAAAHRSSGSGLYWVRQDDAKATHGLYVHLPSRLVVEYGNLFFDARAVLVCGDHPPTVDSGEPTVNPK